MTKYTKTCLINLRNDLRKKAITLRRKSEIAYDKAIKLGTSETAKRNDLYDLSTKLENMAAEHDATIAELQHLIEIA